MKSTIINLTPHPVNVINNNDTITFTPEGAALRLTEETELIGNINGIPLEKKTFGECEGLPEAIEGTFLIVSQIIKSALPNRDDLIVPSNIVRNEKGWIVGCKSFSK